MATTCPNIRSKEWIDLVNKIGTFEAFKEFIKAGGVVPNAENYKESFQGTNATLKVFDALTNKKIVSMYDRFYKTNPEKFYSEVTPIAGKQQTDLLRDFNNNNNPQTLEDMIVGILGELGYTVQTKISMEDGGFEVYNVLKESIDDNSTPPEFQYSVIRSSTGSSIFRTNSLEEANKKVKELGNTSTPTSHYSKLTVPGGTNYVENEIRTPQITPSIKGHAQFATDKGIGWFRSDDKVKIKSDRNFVRMYQNETGEEGEYEDIVYTDEFQEWVSKKQKIADLEDASQVLTRRILEIQSDLFQRGRDKSNLTGEVNESWYYDGQNVIYQGEEYSVLYTEQLEDGIKIFIESIDGSRAISVYPSDVKRAKERDNKNDFLQLLNKDNNWVTFFVKTIMQDSARRGYEKVVFPSGNTANKVEGQQTLDDFIKLKQDRINFINKQIEISKVDGDEDRPYIVGLKKELPQVQKEIDDALAGRNKFTAINSFYQNTIQNILKKQGYTPVEVTDEHNNKWFEVVISPERENQTIFFQVGDKPAITPPVANAGTIRKMKEFLERIGVKVVGVDTIVYSNSKQTYSALADPLNQLIQIVNGKEDVALTEEAMHMAVELVEQTNPSLFKQMMDRISSYNLYQSVFAEYKNYPLYQIDGKPDVRKIKKEAIGKVLAQTIVNLNENTNEKPELLVQTRTWWQKIVDFLKSLFLKAQMNPFEETATQVLSGELTGTLNSGETAFAQSSAYDKIKAESNNIARTGPDSFEVNGTAVKRTTLTDVKEHFRKKLGGKSDEYFSNYKREDSAKITQDINDILNRYIDDNGDLRINPDPHVNPSAANPYDNTLYNTLESHFKDRLEEYPLGTKFLKNVDVFNGASTAGTVDLLAILPNDKIDILQFKVPDIGKNATDIATYKQEAYNIEIEAIRRVLQDGYGIKRDQFRLTRAIPIRALYNTPHGPGTTVLESVIIGGTKISNIQDDILLPVPSLSEQTGNEKFDRLINRLKGLARKLAEERVAPEKRAEKAQRVSALFASIRKLQIQGNAEGILSSARTIIKRQRDLYTTLRDKIDQTDPQNTTIEQLNKLADDILDEKDQVEIYKDLYRSFKEIYTDGSDESKKYLSDARDIADDAQDILDQYWNLSADFRRHKLSAKVGITDSMNPEKQLTWYRRMVRSLSQSQIKAGAILWQLVKRINNTHDIKLKETLTILYGIEGRVAEWLKGKSIEDLYKKIFQFDDKNRWNGRIIPKYDRKFYEDLEKAQERRDLKWVKENIDVDEYNKWVIEEHQRRIDDSKTSRVHENDVENAKIIQQNLQNFTDTYYISTKKGVSPANDRLKSFPLDKWFSNQYKDLLKPENEAVLEVYNYWGNRLSESFRLGMLHDNAGRTWFPNVRREWLEKASTAPAKGKVKSFLFNNVRIESEDVTFGKIDPITGKPIDEVHANFVSDLWNDAVDTDGNYFRDYSEKSMDLFKVIALWDQEILRFKLKTESEALAKLLYYTEAHPDRQALETNRAGGLRRDRDGRTIPISNEINAKYIKEHIDAVYYGKRLATESDVNISIPYGKAVNRINKLFGREILSAPEQETVNISGVKAIETLNRYFVTKTLGLNLFTAVAQLFGGTMNTFMNQGRFFDKKDLIEAEATYVAARFYASDEQKKIAGLIAYIHPYTEDRSEQMIRDLSVSNMVKYLSSDHLFYLQRGSDNWVNRVVAIATFRNTIVEDGKLINVREYARKELGNTSKYSGTYEDAVTLEKKIEARVEELKKSDKALINVAQIVDDQIVIPGIDSNSDTLINFRQSILEVIKDALGNTGREDLSLYKRQVMWQSFFMFKNWIPRMADVRFQSLKYNPGTDRYEYGRVRMLWNAVWHLGWSNTTSLLRKLKGDNSKIVDIAKEEYQNKRKKALEQEEEFELDEAEFIDMYIKGVSAEFKELLLALSLMGILIAARAAAPDKDDDAEIKGAFRWMLRGIDKLTDEVNFFYNPASFTDIVNGSVFPAVSLLVQIQKFFTTAFMKTFYYAIGDEESADKTKVSKHFFKIFPITKELINYLAVFNDDLAKEYGIRLSSQHGNIR